MADNNQNNSHPFSKYVGSVAILSTPAHPSSLAMVQIFIQGGLAHNAPAFLDADCPAQPAGSAVRITGLSGQNGVVIQPL